jgi:hypothetical protein
MHAEATKHVLLGRKSLGCPVPISRSGGNDLGGEPSSRPPLLEAGPLRTGRDGFPSSGSGPLNASFGETR